MVPRRNFASLCVSFGLPLPSYSVGFALSSMIATCTLAICCLSCGACLPMCSQYCTWRLGFRLAFTFFSSFAVHAHGGICCFNCFNSCRHVPCVPIWGLEVWYGIGVVPQSYIENCHFPIIFMTSKSWIQISHSRWVNVHLPLLCLNCTMHFSCEVCACLTQWALIFNLTPDFDCEIDLTFARCTLHFDCPIPIFVMCPSHLILDHLTSFVPCVHVT